MATEQELNKVGTLLKESLDAFFSNKEARVLVLKGDWGVGKTFFWNEYIQECIQDKEHPVMRKMAYSYVSLFGIGSLSRVKEATFHNAEAIQSIASVKEFFATEVESKSLARNFSLLSKQMLPKVARAMKHVPKAKSYQPATSFIQDKMVNNYVVCIDDLERKGKGLSVKEIMGFADALANQKQCKVVLVFNEGCLPKKKDKKEFADYREKVVDVELSYSPSYEENLNHIFDPSLSYYSHLLELVKTVEIKNIRVLKKIKWAIEYFHPKLEGAHAQVINDVITHIVLFCWSFFNSKGAVDFEFVKTRMNRASWAGYFSDNEEKKASKEELEFRGLVSILHVEGAEYDKFITDLLESGYTDIEGFYGEVYKLSEHECDRDIQGMLFQAWDIYADSFKDNLDDFIATIKALLDEQLQRIKIKDFSDAINILSEFGESVDDYITNYTQARRDYLEKIDMKHVRWGDNVNSQLFSLVTSLHDAKKSQSIDEISLKIATKNGWNPDDIEYLYALKEDDYFNWMMSSPPDLVTKVRGGLLSFRDTHFTTDADKYAKILNDVTSALKRIAATSALNSKRVSNIYGIDVDSDVSVSSAE
jgi:hypothetical protein